MRILLCLLFTFLIVNVAQALEIQKISNDVYALVGEMKQRSVTNLANNATFGVVITEEGIVLIDPGGSWQGAKQIDETIQTISDQPVKIVINTGGQDHRWLGNGYWKAKGAKIMAVQEAVTDQKERASVQLSMLRNLLGKALDGTDPVYADLTFETSHNFTYGGLSFELVHAGHAHTPGDIFVRVKERDVLFSGDIVFVERLLGVGPQSNSKEWVEAFKKIASYHPATIVPGHGHVTTLKTAQEQTYDYLLSLRNNIRAHLDAGGDMIDAPKIDQSAFAHLAQFDALAGRNAQQVFSEMEWEE
jgi:glyoxylase-like metal-dependent hydrolase (beta-lactamase superfamily II)